LGVIIASGQEKGFRKMTSAIRGVQISSSSEIASACVSCKSDQGQVLQQHHKKLDNKQPFNASYASALVTTQQLGAQTHERAPHYRQTEHKPLLTNKIPRVL